MRAVLSSPRRAPEFTPWGSGGGGTSDFRIAVPRNMGLRLDILNINFRGARKTLNKTPRGRFLTPERHLVAKGFSGRAGHFSQRSGYFCQYIHFVLAQPLLGARHVLGPPEDHLDPIPKTLGPGGQLVYTQSPPAALDTGDFRYRQVQCVGNVILTNLQGATHTSQAIGNIQHGNFR